MQKGVDYTGIGVVFFCHDGKGNVVFSKRGERAKDEHGVWDIGGGGIEFGETIMNTLRREILEEYCTDVLQQEFLGYREVIRSSHDHWIVLDFKVLVDPEKVANGEPHKFDDVKWFTLGNLPSPLHSQLPIFLEKYKDKLQ